MKEPVPIHAFNPGPITGDGNWTWLIPGRVTTLIDAGAGDSRHLDAVEQALAGARWRRCSSPTRMSITRRAHRLSPNDSAAPASARCPGPRATPRGRWPGCPSRTATSSTPATRRSRSCTRLVTRLTISVSGTRTRERCSAGTLRHRAPRSGSRRGCRATSPHYLASLERVLALEPARLLPAHGPPIDDPQRLLRGYIDHRREREEQVVAALRAGDSTADEIVARVYQGLKPSLVPLAARASPRT